MESIWSSWRWRTARSLPSAYPFVGQCMTTENPRIGRASGHRPRHRNVAQAPPLRPCCLGASTRAKSLAEEQVRATGALTNTRKKRKTRRWLRRLQHSPPLRETSVKCCFYKVSLFPINYYALCLTKCYAIHGLAHNQPSGGECLHSIFGSYCTRLVL